MQPITSKEIEKHAIPEQDVGVCHVSELFDELVASYKKDPREVLGYPTLNWPAFNEAFGGARPGEVVVVTAETGAGKTTFVMNWLLDFVRAKRPALMFSQEIRWSSMIRNIASYVLAKPFSMFKDIDISGMYELLKGLPLYYCEKQGMIEEKFLLKAIDLACRNHGCRFIVIDHLDYIQKSRDAWQSEAYVVGDTMRRICGKAHELNAFVVLIAHPAKLQTHGFARREVGIDELKGSSSIKQESDAVLSLYQPDDERNETILRFQKIRSTEFSKNTRAFLRFKFDPMSQHLIETSTKPEWGNP